MSNTIHCQCGRRYDRADLPAGQQSLTCECGALLSLAGLDQLPSGELPPDDLPETGLAESGLAESGVTTSGQQAGGLGEPDETPPREFFMLLTSDADLRDRINQDAFVHFMVAFDRVVHEFTGGCEEGVAADLQVACALLPNGSKLLDVQVVASEPLEELAGRLKRELEGLAAPPVEDGPVAFASRATVGGGGEAVPAFSFPFSRFMTAGWEGPLDELLMRAGGLMRGGGLSPLAAGEGAVGRADALSVALARRGEGERRMGWWRRLWRRLLLTLGGGAAARQPARRGRVPRRAEPRHEPVAAEPHGDGDDTQREMPVGATSLEELNRLITAAPDDVVLYGLRADLLKEQGHFDAAIRDYSRLLDKRPGELRALSARGEAHCLSGSYREGLADFTEVIRQDPGHVTALQQRGAVYLELEAWNAALADFHAAMALDRRNPGPRLNCARALLAQGDAESAIDHLDKAVELDPHDDEAYALRALARRQVRVGRGAGVEQIQQIVEDASAAIEICPTNARHFLNRAEARLLLNELEGVLEDCSAALELEPGSALAHGFRGVALQQLGREEEAIGDCDRAVEAGFRSPLVYFARAVAHAALEQHDLAWADCQETLELDPEHAGAYNSRGMLRLKLEHDPQAALEDFTRASELAPDWALPLANRGNAHRVLERLDEALDDYDQALELDDECLAAYLNRGLTLADREQWEASVRDFDRALELAADFAPGYLSRALALMPLERWESARNDLDEALRLDPELASAWFHRANLHLHLDDTELALRDFDRLIELAPNLAVAYLGRGNARIEAGQLENARSDFREAIRLEPESAENFLVQQYLAEASYSHQQQQFQAAIEKASEALELDPHSAPALALRAAAHWYDGELVQAAEDYGTLLELDEDSLPALNGRGHVYAEMGEYEQALDDFARLLKLVGEGEALLLAYALNGRALARTGLEQFAEAAADFDRSLELVPGNSWAHYNRGLMFHVQGDQQQARECFQQALDADDPPLTPSKRHRALNYLAQAPGS